MIWPIFLKCASWVCVLSSGSRFFAWPAVAVGLLPLLLRLGLRSLLFGVEGQIASRFGLFFLKWASWVCVLISGSRFFVWPAVVVWFAQAAVAARFA